MTALALHTAARSDVGRRRNNEDAVYASRRLAAVADGVGGHAAGEVGGVGHRYAACAALAAARSSAVIA